MPLEMKITCDCCRRDLTTRSNVTDYRLRLSSESKPHRGGSTVTDMAIEPDIDRDMYFCEMRCLINWVKKEYGLASYKQFSKE